MPAYYQYYCQCGWKGERYRNVRKCPKCGGNIEKIKPVWEVNIGDDDRLTIAGDNLAEVERKINQNGQFTSSMINSVKRIKQLEV